MEKRALLAIILSVAVMAVWQIFFAPSPPPVPPAEQLASGPDGAGTAAGDSVSEPPASPAGSATAPGDIARSPETAEPLPEPTAEVVEAVDVADFRITTEQQDIRLTNAGARATWWRLPAYTVDGGIPVDTIPVEAHETGVLPLQIVLDDDPETTRQLASALFQHEIKRTQSGQRVTFRYSDGRGLEVTKWLEVPESGYLNQVGFQVRRGGRAVPATLVLASGLAEQSSDGTRRYGHVEGQAVAYDGAEVRRVAAPKLDQPWVLGADTGSRLEWAGLESTYFTSVFLQADGPGAASVVFTPRTAPAKEEGGDPVPLISSGLRSSAGGPFELFVGPKDYDLLASLGQNLELVIDFSSFSLIYQLTKYLFLGLTWINSSIGNYGWSIIILTVFVRVVFFPLTYKSAITMRRTSKKMSKVQPKVKAIQERYRKMKKTMESQQKMNQEIMALYKKEGVNPMSNLGGCLPLLLQMPIFIAFYNLLAVTIEMRHAPFIFWIQDLSSRDPYYITPILMGASWLLQQAMTSSSIPDPMQRRMMMLMPLMFTFFMMNMPSGLVIYWLTSNVLGMGQQYITNKKADHLDSHPRAQAA